MKINRNKSVFEPITITIETSAELTDYIAMIKIVQNYASPHYEKIATEFLKRLESLNY